MPPSTPDTSGNGWAEYRALVLSELERLDESLKGNHEDYNARLMSVEQRLGEKLHKIANAQQVMQGQVAALQVKAGVWGALAGLVPTLGVLLLTRL